MVHLTLIRAFFGVDSWACLWGNVAWWLPISICLSSLGPFAICSCSLAGWHVLHSFSSLWTGTPTQFRAGTTISLWFASSIICQPKGAKQAGSSLARIDARLILQSCSWCVPIVWWLNTWAVDWYPRTLGLSTIKKGIRCRFTSQ